MTEEPQTPPVYQWRFQAGKNGHISQWKDVNETAGHTVGYGTNRITSVEFRVKPKREICQAEIHAAEPFSPPRDYLCVHDLGHVGTPHMTSIGGIVVEWPNDAR